MEQCLNKPLWKAKKTSWKDKKNSYQGKNFFHVFQFSFLLSSLFFLLLLRSSHTDVFLGKSVLEICSKSTGEHACRSAISINLLCNFIEIALRHGCSPVNLLHILRTPFCKNTSEGLLLIIVIVITTISLMSKDKFNWVFLDLIKWAYLVSN